MTRPARFGMLTPSSNTVLEPVTMRMLHGSEVATAHFSRFPVLEIGLGERALAQFEDGHILDAAELLAHARMDVIAWNGTSASWLGFETDEALCARITERTGIRAATSVLAFRELFRRLGAARIGLVTPYTGDVQARIAANWGASGFEVVAERHAGLSDNFAFAGLGEGEIRAMIAGVAEARPDAIAIVCTNMAGAALAARMERELGIPVLDSVATTLWGCLEVAGCDKGAFAGWGRIFADPAPGAQGLNASGAPSPRP